LFPSIHNFKLLESGLGDGGAHAPRKYPREYRVEGEFLYGNEELKELRVKRQ